MNDYKKLKALFIETVEIINLRDKKTLFGSGYPRIVDARDEILIVGTQRFVLSNYDNYHKSIKKLTNLAIQAGIRYYTISDASAILRIYKKLVDIQPIGRPFQMTTLSNGYDVTHISILGHIFTRFPDENKVMDYATINDIKAFITAKIESAGVHNVKK